MVLRLARKNPHDGLDIDGNGFAFASGLIQQSTGEYIFAQDRDDNLCEKNPFTNANVINREALKNTGQLLQSDLTSLLEKVFPSTYLPGLAIRGRIKELNQEIERLLNCEDQDPVNLTYDIREVLNRVRAVIEKSPTTLLCNQKKFDELMRAFEKHYQAFNQIHHECRVRTRHMANVLLDDEVKRRQKNGETILFLNEEESKGLNSESSKSLNQDQTSEQTLGQEPAQKSDTMTSQIDTASINPITTEKKSPVASHSLFSSGTIPSDKMGPRETETPLLTKKIDTEKKQGDMDESYRKAHSQLTQLISNSKTLDSQLKLKVAELINETHEIYQSSRAPTEPLVNVLSKTHDLLTDTVSVDDYMSEASDLHAQFPASKLFLGLAMKMVGVAIVFGGIPAVTLLAFCLMPFPLTLVAAFICTGAAALTALVGGGMWLGGEHILEDDLNKNKLSGIMEDIGNIKSSETNTSASL
ncbi:hypothetical protein [Legionella sp. W05-934-2]|uniref:hypothetical protein n=1 Tax=Legionella sp. W05-934-2 TaxID=1198649 RepID=UPI003461884B